MHVCQLYLCLCFCLNSTYDYNFWENIHLTYRLNDQISTLQIPPTPNITDILAWLIIAGMSLSRCKSPKRHYVKRRNHE